MYFHFPHCQYQLSLTKTIESNTMILLKFVILISSALEIHGQLYKRIVLNVDECSKFVHKTIPHNVKTKIECGAACSADDKEYGNCDLFIYKQVSVVCKYVY